MIVKTDPDAIRPYTEDASGMKGGRAERVHLPADEAEAAALLAECSARGEPLTISGGGTGLTGARIPLGGSVLATDLLGGVRGLRREGACGAIVAGPALTLADLHRAAAGAGLMYGPDPTETAAWIGGTVATNASGSRTFRYGPTRRHVRGLRVALATGDVIDLPRGKHRAGGDGSFALPLPSGREIRGSLPPYAAPRVKSASGYATGPGLDLVDLFIGSEGTLGLVTEIELALLPAPDGVLAGIVFFREEAAAREFLRQARERSYAARGFPGPAPVDPREPGAAGPAGAEPRIDARALEYFDASSLDFMRPHHGGIPGTARAAILFEQETSSRSEEEVQGAWLSLAEAHGALGDESWYAVEGKDLSSLHAFRHALPTGINEWLSRRGQRKIGADMAVGDGAFDAMFRLYEEILGGSGLRWLAFGHLGDNHLHVNVLPGGDEEARRGREAYEAIVAGIVSLGGTISAEHGLGKIKASYLGAMYGEEVFGHLVALKRAFDPALVLCRGNMIPEGLLPPPRGARPAIS